MAQKNTLFDRLALKETVKINKQLQGLNTLREELKKISSMRDKLEDMASQTGHEYAGQSGFSLWSAARLNQKIRDQLDTARNRTEHLDEEIQEIGEILLNLIDGEINQNSLQQQKDV